MIVFKHIRDMTNVGDIASCPQRWFSFPGALILNYSEPPEDCDAIVYGGGTMVNWLNCSRDSVTVPKILWGAGSSRHGHVEPWPDPEGFVLVGTREWSAKREEAGKWAPCASCMSPLFDLDHDIENEAVLFLNASPGIRSRYPVSMDGLPIKKNNERMDDVIAFLGSAETIITDSYHGVYWGTLLGRKVVAIPYSSKFYRIKHPPVLSLTKGGNWREEAKNARTYPEALTECREATVSFYERVLDVVQ